jgi:hypothetical protein
MLKYFHGVHIVTSGKRAGANDTVKVRHYKQNGGENQACLKAGVIVALPLSDAASVAG